MGGMHGFGLTDRALAELYRTTTGPVAFIDESYREPLHSDERPFYSMSAVIVGRDQGALVRDVLMDIPGSTYWHTTEAYRSPAGKRVIKEMIVRETLQGMRIEPQNCAARFVMIPVYVPV